VSNEASGIGVVTGSESGGKKLQAETVSAETLEFLKVGFPIIDFYQT
jgi:hypothetical protein